MPWEMVKMLHIHIYIHVNILTGIPGAVTAQSVSLACLKQKGFLLEAIMVKFLSTLVPFMCFQNTARLSYSYQCVCTLLAEPVSEEVAPGFGG